MAMFLTSGAANWFIKKHIVHCKESDTGLESQLSINELKLMTEIKNKTRISKID